MEATVNHQELSGTIVKVSSAKTVRVAIKVTKMHPLYHKRYTLTKFVVAHDESAAAQVGDVVTVAMCRPMSKNKRWTLVQK